MLRYWFFKTLMKLKTLVQLDVADVLQWRMFPEKSIFIAWIAVFEYLAEMYLQRDAETLQTPRATIYGMPLLSIYP